MDLDATLTVLRQVPYFLSLPALDLRALATNLRTGRYQSGDVIFRKGDPSAGLCIVVSGRVRTVTSTPDGREQVLKMFGPGRTFAEIAVFDDEPQPADAIAVTDSLIAFVPQATLLGLVRQHPDVAIDVIRLFASRLRAYKQMVEDLSLRPVIARVARMLADRARGTQTLVEESATASLRYTQDELAAMVGSVREVVQRALKTLEHAGLIEMARRQIHVVDLEALDGWAESTSNALAPLSW